MPWPLQGECYGPAPHAPVRLARVHPSQRGKSGSWQYIGMQLHCGGYGALLSCLLQNLEVVGGGLAITS